MTAEPVNLAFALAFALFLFGLVAIASIVGYWFGRNRGRAEWRGKR